MASLVLRGGRVLTPDGWRTADVEVVDGYISSIGAAGPRSEVPATDVADVSGLSVVPGFIDLHVHGAGGAWADGGADAVRTMATALARGGVTSFLATTVAAPIDALADVVRAVASADDPVGGARCLGVHLEGPWLSPVRAGAQPVAHLRAPDLADLTALLDAGPVRLVTLAPELPGALDAVRSLVARGVVVGLGHSDASYDETQAAVEAGARHVTHAFNAMRALHHREPGLVGAALTMRELTSVEVIADGVHVHPEVVRLLVAARGADAVCLVSDGVDGCLANHDLVRDGTAIRRGDGTLAGSAATLGDAVRTCVGWGIALEDAVRMASSTPARVLGRPDMGTIVPGALADLVVLGEGGTLQATYVGGEQL